MARRINAPGIEVNELDRSNYDETVDNSTVGTATLVLGFGDRGDDYSVKWINTMNAFVRNYGMPTNDAERYFYNAAFEVLDGGGVCYTAKLPYYNDALDNFVYTSYTVDRKASKIEPVVGIVSSMISSDSGSLYELLFDPFKFEGGIWNAINNSSVSTRFQYMDDFVDYVVQNANFGIDDQTVLMNNLLSAPQYWRTPTYLVNDILSYEEPGTDLSAYDAVSANMLSMKRAIQGGFGVSASMDSVVRQFAQTLYLEDFYNFYVEISSFLEDKTPDFDDTLSSFQLKYTELNLIDDSITSYAAISATANGENELMSFQNYDKFLIKELRVPLNKIYIVDKTRGQYGKDEFGNEVVGIVPVIVTPANAMFYQEIIRKDNGILSDYNVVGKLRNSFRTGSYGVFEECLEPFDATNTQVSSRVSAVNDFIGLGNYLGAEVFDDGTRVTVDDYTVSQHATENFPTIRFNSSRLDREYLDQIGIVVFRLFRDQANDGKISFTALESFVGSLDRRANSATRGQKQFIDDVVNNGSDYINVFSNVDISEENDPDPLGIKNASIYATSNQVACSMSFFERDTRKNIHVTKSIYEPMLKIFERNQDRNNLDIDLLADGGISNIAQFIASAQLYRRDPRTDAKVMTQQVKDEFQRYGKFDFNDEDAYLFRLEQPRQINVWKKVLQRFDEFARYTRKDFLFLADGPRPLCLDGNSKIIRPSKPGNTVVNSILPKMRFVSGVVNSSYSTGYLNWFWSLDHSSGDYMWMPPSLKMLGVYLYTDNMGAYWDAPAGLNRGKLKYTLDVAFNPSNEEAGQIYINSWNYAVSYPLDGIVAEGQKTFQSDKTALDRNNVRRLMLGLEKTVRNFCKYFNYEGNTQFQRLRLKDAIDRYLEQVRANDGISQYLTVCDERNNTAQTIDNNELHVAVAVRPVKSIEFIVLQFVATSQSVDVAEAMTAELGA